MFRWSGRLLIALILIAPAQGIAQTPTNKTFEVATIKPAAPLNPAAIASGQMPRIGLNVQGTRVDIGMMSLADLITAAYKTKPYLVSGPDWMKTERFDIVAKMPEGATKDDVPQMLQALLAERFGLKIHKDTREEATYALVAGKDANKLKEAPADPEPASSDSPGAAPGAPQVKFDRAAGGATVTTPQGGTTKMSMTPDGHMRLEMSKMSMEGLAGALNPLVDHPVFDMTGLKGNYQIALDLPLDTLLAVARAQGMNLPALGGRGGPGGGTEALDPSGASSIFTSIQQLGLRLEPRKMPLEHVVVDHVEKTPTEN